MYPSNPYEGQRSALLQPSFSILLSSAPKLSVLPCSSGVQVCTLVWSPTFLFLQGLLQPGDSPRRGPAEQPASHVPPDFPLNCPMMITVRQIKGFPVW